MPAVKAANPKTIFSAQDWAAMTRVSTWRGLWLVVHAWMVVALTAFGGAWAWNVHWFAGLAATPVVLAILGGRQLGLAILMHDGAHGLLHPDRKLNNWLGQWPSGAATGSDLHAYRAYHLTHHKFTQQDEDPDLGLSRPFPTSPASLRRKVIRDLTGQTFFKQRRSQFAAALRGASSTRHTVARFLAVAGSRAGGVANCSGVGRRSCYGWWRWQQPFSCFCASATSPNMPAPPPAATTPLPMRARPTPIGGSARRLHPIG